MYLRWAADRGFQTELLEASPGEEAGLKSATFTVAGENAYGILKAERGVHRLVRLSPVRPGAPAPHVVRAGDRRARCCRTRATSRSTRPSCGSTRTARAAPAASTSNKTDSAVRITHLPTGIVVQCQNERSQSSNKQTAMRILRSRLAELEEEKREAELARGARRGAGHRLRQPDPQLCAPPVPARQGPPHRPRGRQRAGRPRRRPRRLHPRVPARQGRRRQAL